MHAAAGDAGEKSKTGEIHPSLGRESGTGTKIEYQKEHLKNFLLSEPSLSPSLSPNPQLPMKIPVENHPNRPFPDWPETQPHSAQVGTVLVP